MGVLVNVTGILNTKAATTAIGILAGGALLYFVANRIIERVAPKVGEALNPTSDQNLAYRSVNGVGSALSGDPSWSLGSWLYDVFNPPYDPNAGAKYEPRKLSVRKEAGAYNWLANNG